MTDDLITLENVPEKALYFAYCTLIGQTHMLQKYTTARAVGPATYPDHEVSFWKYGEGVEGGSCTFVEAPGSSLMGTLYEVGASDLPALLALGDTSGAWDQRIIEVTTADGAKVTAVTLRLAKEHGMWAVEEAYGNLMLDGAREEGFPQEYQEQLRGIVDRCRAS